MMNAARYLNASSRFVDDDMSIGEDETIAVHDEAGAIADGDRLACVVIPHTAILDLDVDKTRSCLLYQVSNEIELSSPRLAT